MEGESSNHCVRFNVYFSNQWFEYPVISSHYNTRWRIDSLSILLQLHFSQLRSMDNQFELIFDNYFSQIFRLTESFPGFSFHLRNSQQHQRTSLQRKRWNTSNTKTVKPLISMDGSLNARISSSGWILCEMFRSKKIALLEHCFAFLRYERKFGTSHWYKGFVFQRFW